jgi:hypothetical protein
MSSPGNHAADDGSLARSTGGAAARGAMLIALALVIGLVLMAFALDDPATELSSTDGTSGETDDTTTDGTTSDDDSGVVAVDPGDDDGETTVATIPEDDDGVTETIPPLDETGEARPASEVTVLVANGTGGKGVAGSVSDKLKARSYIANAANAPSTAEAVIYYRVGYDADARAIAEILGAPPDIIKPAPGDGTIKVAAGAISDGRLTSANVVVIIGNDNNIPTS